MTPLPVARMPYATDRGAPTPGQCDQRVDRDGDPSRNCVLSAAHYGTACEDTEGYFSAFPLTR